MMDRYVSHFNSRPPRNNYFRFRRISKLLIYRSFVPAEDLFSDDEDYKPLVISTRDPSLLFISNPYFNCLRELKIDADTNTEEEMFEFKLLNPKRWENMRPQPYLETIDTSKTEEWSARHLEEDVMKGVLCRIISNPLSIRTMKLGYGTHCFLFSRAKKRGAKHKL